MIGRTCKVTYNHGELYGEPNLICIHDIEGLYIYRLEAYIYLILYVEHNEVTTFRGNAKENLLPTLYERTYI